MVQVMACCLFGTKPLPEPLLMYCQLYHKEQTWVKFEAKYNDFHWTVNQIKIYSLPENELESVVCHKCPSLFGSECTKIFLEPMQCSHVSKKYSLTSTIKRHDINQSHEMLYADGFLAHFYLWNQLNTWRPKKKWPPFHVITVSNAICWLKHYDDVTWMLRNLNSPVIPLFV